MARSKVTVDANSAHAYYDSGTGQLQSYFSLTATEVSYQVGGTRTATSYGSSSVSVIVSTSSKDCFGIMEATDVTGVDITLGPTQDLVKGIDGKLGNNGNGPNTSNVTVSVLSNEWIKIFSQPVAATN